MAHNLSPATRDDLDLYARIINAQGGFKAVAHLDTLTITDPETGRSSLFVRSDLTTGNLEKIAHDCAELQNVRLLNKARAK